MHSAKRDKRQLISSTPKFYFFDTGVINYLRQEKINILKSEMAGHAFEHFILMELIAYRDYSEKSFSIEFWRTKTGIEVDFVIGKNKAIIEVKITDKPQAKDFYGLKAFAEHYPIQQMIVVCQAPRKRKISLGHNQAIDILPWQEFLTQLWNDKIIKD